MTEQGYNEFIKRYDERIDNMSKEEFDSYCDKLGAKKEKLLNIKKDIEGIRPLTYEEACEKYSRILNETYSQLKKNSNTETYNSKACLNTLLSDYENTTKTESKHSEIVSNYLVQLPEIYLGLNWLLVKILEEVFAKNMDLFTSAYDDETEYYNDAYAAFIVQIAKKRGLFRYDTQEEFKRSLAKKIVKKARTTRENKLEMKRNNK